MFFILITKRLLRLELVGYKTFAGRTIFDFGEGINCIIGPNGSGKSNVVDSLRWVLGEQSYSLLRGKKTDDMIFNGSQQRARASMASAALTFDNSDGWLPVDFAEVTITRRAYRDGRNDYYINDQRARLKDIAELLGKVGLAQRNYTIIGQGLIDHFLMLKTDERRAIFEEAAGIGVYQDKRHETLRRLEQTEHNQERVEDVLSEIRPRLKALEKQAERALQAGQLQNELLARLRVWYGYQYHALQETLSNARQQAETANRELHTLQDAQNLADIELNALRNTIGNLRAQLASWRRETARQHTEHEAITRQLAVAEERLRNLNEQSGRLQGELVQLEANLKLRQDRLESAQKDVKRFEEERNLARTQVEQLENLRRKRIQERQVLQSQQQQAEQALSAVERRQTEVNARTQSLHSRQDRLFSESQLAEQSLQQAQTQLSQCQSTLASQATLVEQAQSELHATQQRPQTLQQELTNLEQAFNHLNAELGKAIAHAERLTARQQVLTNEQETTHDSARQQVRQAAKNGKLSGYQGEITSILQSKAEFDTAIAAALGPALQASVFENWQGVDDVLALLNGKANGQYTLLPIQHLHPPEPTTLPIQGFLGWASEQVQCPASARPVVDVLLGKVALCADRQSARQVVHQLPLGGIAVTLDGELYRADGLVVVGKVSGTQALALAREARALPMQIETARQRQHSLEAERTQLQNERHQRTGELSAARQAVSAAQQNLQTITRSWQTAQLDVERAQARLQLQKEQIERAHKEQTEIGEQLKKLESEKATLAEQKRSAEQKIRALRNQLLEFDADNPAEQLPQWQTKLAVSEQSLRNVRTQQDDHQHQLQNAHKQLEQRLQHKKHLQNELAENNNRILGLRDQDIQFQNALDELRGLRRPAEQQLEELERKLIGAEQAESGARSLLQAAQQRNANAQLAFSRRQDELQRLEQQISDDFGPVELDVQSQSTLPIEELVLRLEKVAILPAGIDEQIKQKRTELRKLGAVNPDALREHDETKARHDDLVTQLADLTTAGQQLREIIAELDVLMEREFRKTYDQVAKKFTSTFTRLFNGGTARLVLTDPENIHNTGIDMIATLPGRREQGLELLSGGERSLTACALIFALLQTTPTPFAVLDEVDAMLDEANVGRLRDLLIEMAQKTQFVVVTHNRNTVEAANTVYGISMSPDSTSKQISLRLDGKTVPEKN